MFTFIVFWSFCNANLHTPNYQNLETNEDKFEKVYLSPQDISIFNNEILVSVNGQWTQVNELYSDQIGIHFKRKVGLWYCKGCGWHNEDVPVCAQCGRPRPA